MSTTEQFTPTLSPDGGGLTSSRTGGSSVHIPVMEKQRAHTSEEWEAIRPIFTKYYAERGWTLLQTQETLLNEHNFYAT